MSVGSTKDHISQAELRKGAELMIGTSSAACLVRELYLDALKRRLAAGALIEPEPLGFVHRLGVVLTRKGPGSDGTIAVVEHLSSFR